MRESRPSTPTTIESPSATLGSGASKNFGLTQFGTSSALPSRLPNGAAAEVEQNVTAAISGREKHQPRSRRSAPR